MSDEDSSKGRNSLCTAIVVLLIFALVVSIWIGIGFLPARNLVPGFDFSENGVVDGNKPGVFGDSFGWINSLFSALAFAGILVTLWMQRRELKLQRDELIETRKQHQRMATAQEESENRLFLAAYMNTIESLRQLSQWRMSANPATTKHATFPTVHGLVIQQRVIQSLHSLIKELEPEIGKLHPKLSEIGEKGSWVWRLEELLGVHLSLREIYESHHSSTDDIKSFVDAENKVKIQLSRLRDVKKYFGKHRHASIDQILNQAPDTYWIAGDITGDQMQAREARQKFLSKIPQVNDDILSFIMSACHE